MKTRATAYPLWNAFLPAADSPLPLREQLLRFLRKGVAEGSLAAGVRLPARPSDAPGRHRRGPPFLLRRTGRALA